MFQIPFNKPYMTGKEVEYISQAVELGHLSGNGPFTRKCQQWLEYSIGCQKALLTHSGTAALEMAALLLDLKPGDEVIMPSFTFVSTANAFVLRGTVPVFVDIRPDTMNIDENQLEKAITEKTKAIVIVHYAGVGCEMDQIMEIAGKYHIPLIEDAAHCVQAYYKGRELGSFGQLAILSFHETKNIIAGEGGALLINDASLAERAEIIWEKGTNRSQFFRGEVDKYTWVDIGSSFLPNEQSAAFLWAQMEMADIITAKRLNIWHQYHRAFQPLEEKGLLLRPEIPPECQHNAHMYHLRLNALEARTAFIESLKAFGIHSVFHYIPLHSSPAGQKYGRPGSSLIQTESISECLVRLPLWFTLSNEEISYIIDHVFRFFDVARNTTECVGSLQLQ